MNAAQCLAVLLGLALVTMIGCIVVSLTLSRMLRHVTDIAERAVQTAQEQVDRAEANHLRYLGAQSDLDHALADLDDTRGQLEEARRALTVQIARKEGVPLGDII